MTHTARNSASKVAARLRGYWKMEAACAALIPLAVLFLTMGRPGWLVAIVLLPNVLLLAVGAAYWRAKLLRIEKGRPLAATLRVIAAARRPAMVLTAIACLATGAAATGLWPTEVGPRRLPIALGLATLAVAEYANYYWRQLQHFDHLADLRRLAREHGFRPSQLRRDLDRHGLG
jgi:hypothetical protein